MYADTGVHCTACGEEFLDVHDAMDAEYTEGMCSPCWNASPQGIAEREAYYASPEFIGDGSSDDGPRDDDF